MLNILTGSSNYSMSNQASALGNGQFVEEIDKYLNAYT
jgi:hypothetical protein